MPGPIIDYRDVTPVPFPGSIEGGWYHVMPRGIERRVIFLEDSFCLHFLDLLGEMSRCDIESDM